MNNQARGSSLLLFILLLFFGAGMTAADVYKWKDAQGRTHFSNAASDIPANARRVDSGNISTVKNPSLNNRRIRVPFFRNAGGTMMVQGEVNGILMSFIVDTGASFVAIPPAIAERARISTKGAPSIMMQTANGRVMAPQVTLREVKIPGLKQKNVTGVVQKLSPDGRTGLLGMSFLGAYRMTIDDDNSQLIMERK